MLPHVADINLKFHQPFHTNSCRCCRCRMYTGHVTAGGSICLESLTVSGTTGSWQPTFCVEGMLQLIVMNMIHTPVQYIQTTTGPGGLSGPLRVEFGSGNPLAGYSNSEAKAAFERTMQNHRNMGWPGSTAVAPTAGNSNASSSSSGSASTSGTSAASPDAPSPPTKRLKTVTPEDFPATEQLGAWPSLHR
jgi:hypothetical protein